MTQPHPFRFARGQTVAIADSDQPSQLQPYRKPLVKGTITARMDAADGDKYEVEWVTSTSELKRKWFQEKHLTETDGALT